MRLFIFTFFCSCLTSGKLQAVNNVNLENIKLQSNADNTVGAGNLVPVLEEHIWPMQAYQTFRGNFYGTAERSINTKPCPRHGSSQDVRIEQESSKQLTASPTRRASIPESEVMPLRSNGDDNDEVNHLRTTVNEESLRSSSSNNHDDIVDYTKNSAEISTSAEDLKNEPDPIISEPVVLREEIDETSETSSEHMSSPTVEHEVPPVQSSKTQCSNKRTFNTANEAPRRIFMSAVPVVSYNNYEKTFVDNNKALRSSSNANKTPRRFSTGTMPVENPPVPYYYERTYLDNDNAVRSSSNIGNAYSHTVLNSDAGSQEKRVETNYELRSDYQNNEHSREKPADRSGKIRFMVGDNNQLHDPTKGDGISYVKKTTLMLMDFDRVCYACSSANNPTCLSPDRRTPVKYCRKGDTSCVTKTFGTGNTLTLIRDCGNERSCDEKAQQTSSIKYKACSVCQADLCNSAISISVQSLILIPSILLIILGKPIL